MEIIKKRDISHHIESFFGLDESDHKSKNTNKNYYTDLKQFAQYLGFEDIFDVPAEVFESFDAGGLKAYISSLTQVLKDDYTKMYTNGSINRKMSSIKSLFAHLTGYEAISFVTEKLDVVKPLPKDTKTIPMIPLSDLLDYIEYAKKNMANGNEKSLVMLLGLETGLRVKELLELEWSQFQVDGKVVTIMSNNKNKGKGNKDYIDKISISVYNRLREGLSTGLGTGSDKLFTISYETVNRTMSELGKIFGHEKMGYTFHSIKKTCVTMVYRRTGCILQAQKKARHKSIETTRMYLALEDVEITGVVSLMDSTDMERYKGVEQDKLVKAIESMPYEMRLLLNDKLGAM